jgi:hypothetical protein
LYGVVAETWRGANTAVNRPQIAICPYSRKSPTPLTRANADAPHQRGRPRVPERNQRHPQRLRVLERRCHVHQEVAAAPNQARWQGRPKAGRPWTRPCVQNLDAPHLKVCSAQSRRAGARPQSLPARQTQPLPCLRPAWHTADLLATTAACFPVVHMHKRDNRTIISY